MTPTLRSGVAVLAFSVTLASMAASQTPPPSEAGQAAEPTPTSTSAPSTPGAAGQPGVQAGFTYNSEGRRDPFLSLLRRGTTAQRGQITVRPPGLPGLGIGEVTLRGTVQSREGWVGVLQGSDEKTYIVRPGDKLFDGAVRSISQNEMVFLQEVNDPLSLEKQREVTKLLRQVEAN